VEGSGAEEEEEEEDWLHPVEGHHGTPCAWFGRLLPAGEHAVCCGDSWGTGVFLEPVPPPPHGAGAGGAPEEGGAAGADEDDEDAEGDAGDEGDEGEEGGEGGEWVPPGLAPRDAGFVPPPTPPKLPTAAAAPATTAAAPAAATRRPRVRFTAAPGTWVDHVNGGDIGNGKVPSLRDCRRWCHEHAECASFSFRQSDKACYVRRGSCLNTQADEGFSSGFKLLASEEAEEPGTDTGAVDTEDTVDTGSVWRTDPHSDTAPQFPPPTAAERRRWLQGDPGGDPAGAGDGPGAGAGAAAGQSQGQSLGAAAAAGGEGGAAGLLECAAHEQCARAAYCRLVVHPPRAGAAVLSVCAPCGQCSPASGKPLGGACPGKCGLA
jgi:hypothetical protein